MEEHPNWKVPERRLNKFVKRRLNKAALDDDVSLLTTESSATRKRFSLFRRVFSRKKNDLTPPVTPENTQEQSKSAPPESAPETIQETEEVKDEVVDEVVATEPALEGVSRNLEGIYEDDNTGSEKDKCECNACAIM